MQSKRLPRPVARLASAIIAVLLLAGGSPWMVALSRSNATKDCEPPEPRKSPPDVPSDMALPDASEPETEPAPDPERSEDGAVPEYMSADSSLIAGRAGSPPPPQ